MRKSFLLCVCVLLISTAFFPVRLTAQQREHLERMVEVIQRLDDINNSIKAFTAVYEKSLQPAVPAAAPQSQPQVSADPDYIKLFQRRLEIAKERFKSVEAKHNVGAKGGEPNYYNNAQIAIADAEAALYRVTGEKEKVRLALERKLKAAKNTLGVAKIARESGTIEHDKFLDAEVAVIEAEIELKQATATSVGATTAAAGSSAARSSVQYGQVESLMRDMTLAEIKLLTLRAERKMLKETIENPQRIPQAVISQIILASPELQKLTSQLDRANSAQQQVKTHVKSDDPRLQQYDSHIADLEKKIDEYVNGAKPLTEYHADIEKRIWELDMEIRTQEILMHEIQRKIAGF